MPTKTSRRICTYFLVDYYSPVTPPVVADQDKDQPDDSYIGSTVLFSSMILALLFALPHNPKFRTSHQNGCDPGSKRQVSSAHS